MKLPIQWIHRLQVQGGMAMLMIVDQVLADLASRMSTAGPVQQMMAKMGAATKVIIIVMVMMLMISMIFMLMISMTCKDEGDTI